MKIGLVCPYNMNKGGGVQECVRALQSGLKARGHQALILTPRPRDVVGKRKNMIFLGGATDVRTVLHTTAQVSVSVDGNEIDRVLEREDFDVLHFHEPWVPILSRQILSRSTAVNVATFHAKLPETIMSRTVGRVITPYTKSILRYLHELTAVSEAAADYVCSLTDQSVKIIPNGISLSLYHAPRRINAQSLKTILYIGRLEKRKGVDYLLDAMAQLVRREPDVRLLVAGDGPDRAKLENLCAELELNEHVEFLGFVSETKKRQLLHEADLFCSPALYGESFGIVLLEAMASGLVTVAGNNPGYSAVLEGLGSISLINPKDTSEFVRRLALLLGETDLRKLWVNWARKTVPDYDYDKIVDRYETIYHDALKKYQ